MRPARRTAIGGAGGLARRRPLQHRRTVIRDPLTGLPFPNNQIPLDRFSPTARAILQRHRQLPPAQPNVTGASAGNYVGECSFNVRAHQGDLRLDWNASRERQAVRALLLRHLRGPARRNAFPLVFAAPQRPALLQRRRQLDPRARIVGHQRGAGRVQPHAPSSPRPTTGRAIGGGNALYGIAGGQPIDGLSCLTSAAGACTAGFNGLTPLGAIATDSDTLAKTYQLNEKLTWLKGRHSFKFGGQILHYDQQRFYAGNNGLLGYLAYNGAFTGSAFADFLLDQVSGKGRGGGDPEDPWTHVQNRIALFVQDDFKLRSNFTLNAGLRWAYTSPLVEKDNRQSNFDLETGEQILASDGGLEERALYKPYYKGFEPRLGFAWSASDRMVVRGGYGISQFMEGTGANLRLPLNPPFFFESAAGLRPHHGGGHGVHRLRRPRARHDAVRQRARVRSRPPPAVHPAVERVRGVPRHRRACRPRSATSATTRRTS